MARTKGFTLIELTIVIVVILIITAITIPRLLRSRMSAEETSAIGSMRMIATAEAQVLGQSLFPDPVTRNSLYADFDQLATLSPPIIDAVLTTAPNIKSGYQFSIDLNTQTPAVPDFNAYGLVLRVGTNLRSFYVDPGGVIHYTNDGTVQGVSSPTLQ